MSTSNSIKNVAIVGGTGNLGSIILASLLAKKSFKVTAITRKSSAEKLPSDSSLQVAAGEYDDAGFLSSALANQDVLIIVLGFMAPPDLQTRLIEAAVEVGIKWIVPTEFGSDNANPKMAEGIPTNAGKTPIRQYIEKQGITWLGVATNAWFDYSLRGGFFGIDVTGRKATLYNGGTTKFNTTNMGTVGPAVVSLLSLPITSSSGPSLSDYANKFAYISSHLTNQKEILAAVQRATQTGPVDWEITEDTAERYIQEGKDRMAKGDFYGAINILYGNLFIEGSGGNYEDTKDLANRVLGLPEEDLDKSVETVLATLKR